MIVRIWFWIEQKEYQLLELELARSRVSVNRVAVAAASEWKEDSDKVIPVKQWVEERKYLQGEMKQMQVSCQNCVTLTSLQELFKGQSAPKPLGCGDISQ